MLRHGAGPGVPEDTGQVECYGMWRFFLYGYLFISSITLGSGRRGTQTVLVFFLMDQFWG